MKYEVLETQNHTEPIEDWTVVFTTDNEDIACEWMTKHYNTQISDEGNYDPATDCGCEDCADGFRVADWKGLTMQLRTTGYAVEFENFYGLWAIIDIEKGESLAYVASASCAWDFIRMIEGK